MAPSRRPPPPRPLPQTTFRPQEVPPSRGGTNGYPESFRNYVLGIVCDADGNFDPFRYEMADIDAQNRGVGDHFPCKRTVQNWIARKRNFGHARAYVKQGNERATVLRGEALLRLAWYKLLYPRSNAHETNAFLWNSSPEPPGQRRLYTPGQISAAEDSLCLSRKVSATTARQALLPINQQKRWNFWNLEYPFGIANINREDLIDMDEAAVFIETVNRKYGKATIGRRCREVGPYGHSTKHVLTMAVSACPNDKYRDYLLEQKSGTTILDFVEFIQRILLGIGPGTPERRRCFLMDNLSAHHSPIIYQLIADAGHRIVFRAPYYPEDGPIEFVFNHIEQRLTDYQYHADDADALRQAVQEIVTRMESFENFFTHCGY